MAALYAQILPFQQNYGPPWGPLKSHCKHHCSCCALKASSFALLILAKFGGNCTGLGPQHPALADLRQTKWKTLIITHRNSIHKNVNMDKYDHSLYIIIILTWVLCSNFTFCQGASSAKPASNSCNSSSETSFSLSLYIRSCEWHTLQ